MNDIFLKISEIGIIPVIILENAQYAERLAATLIRGGLPCAEVTFRTEGAQESIYRMTSAYPGMLVGAGTVLNIDQAQCAFAAGAKFIVSPGLNPKVVEYCVNHDIPVCPGICTPSEIEQALDFGIEVVKFFPAELSGGVDMIKAMAAPYKMVKFIPTGGINEGNVRKYLMYDRVLACGGSWMLKKDLIAKGEFEQITKTVREAASIVKEVREKRREAGNEP